MTKIKPYLEEQAEHQRKRALSVLRDSISILQSMVRSLEEGRGGGEELPYVASRLVSVQGTIGERQALLDAMKEEDR